MCSHRGDDQQDSRYDCQDSIRVAPTVGFDHALDDGDEHECSGSYSCDCQAEGEGASLLEPASDSGDHRHVTACDPAPDAESVGEVAEANRGDRGGKQETGHHRNGAEDHHTSRPDAISDSAADDPDREVGERGDRKEQRRRRSAGSEFVGHGSEELAEAVRNPEHGEHGEERGGHNHPCSCRVDLVGTVVVATGNRPGQHLSCLRVQVSANLALDFVLTSTPY